MTEQSIIEKVLGRPATTTPLSEGDRDRISELIGCCTTDAGKLDRGKLRKALAGCSSGALNKMLKACKGEGDSDEPAKPTAKKDDGKSDAAASHNKAKADHYAAPGEGDEKED